MAPSFSLFNTSFDSITDIAQYQNHPQLSSGQPPQNSFSEAFPSGSFNQDSSYNPYLSRSNSYVSEGGPAIQQKGSVVMLGVSPSNSFGYGGAPPGRSSSPHFTQVIQSGGSKRYEDRGFGYPPSSPGYPIVATASSGSAGSDGQYFYNVLRKFHKAFQQCSFLLPGLKIVIQSGGARKDGSGGTGGNGGGAATPPRGDVRERKREEGEVERQKAAFLPTPSRLPIHSSPKQSLTEDDILIATRRVTCAICAFGGMRKPHAQQSSTPTPSIFRQRFRKTQTEKISEEKEKYKKLLSQRYYESENHLSWENEENPPVEASSATEEGEEGSAEGETDTPKRKAPMDSSEGKNVKRLKTDPPSTPSSSPIKDEPDDDTEETTAASTAEKKPPSPTPVTETPTSTPAKSKKEDSPSSSAPDTPSNASSSQPKMKYRCKLCGLPKQNHVCTFQQSLQRSIGTQIYPALNAFTADEPGVLAPALSEMNNFVGDAGGSSTETSPTRPSPGRMITEGSSKGSPANVTPETIRGAMMQANPGMNSPGSSISFSPHGTPYRKPHPHTPHTPHGSSRRKPMTPMSAGRYPDSPSHSTPSRKRKHYPSSPANSQHNSTADLFVEAMELKPEQYRIVTPTKTPPNSYSYPTLPLPYTQRKRLSDNLFALSKEIPQLTDECAVVLREARERDMWDQAVAELMTQVIVVIHCQEDDRRLVGLRQYLLGLGIAC